MAIITEQREWTSSSPIERDRRAYPRKRAKASGKYRPIERPLLQAIIVKLVDISQGGIGMLVPEALPTGAELEIEMIPTAGPGSVVATAEVRWSAPNGKGFYRVGCRWTRPLTYADLQRVI